MSTASEFLDSRTANFHGCLGDNALGTIAYSIMFKVMARQGRFIYIVHVIHKGFLMFFTKIKVKYSR